MDLAEATSGWDERKRVVETLALARKKHPDSRTVSTPCGDETHQLFGGWALRARSNRRAPI